MCRLRLLLLAILLGAAAAAAAPPPPRPPTVAHAVAVIGHRGGSALAPENTLAAFRNAIALGCDFVEMDVRETKDHQLVLMHDRTADRTTHGTGAVADLGLLSLRALDAGSRFGTQFAGERVPTFDQALDLCAGRIGIYLDHKAGPISAILRAIRNHRMSRQVVVYDGPEEVAAWKRQAPTIPVMVTPDDKYRVPGGMAALAQVSRAELMDGHFLAWTADLVAEAHAAGRKVYVDIMGPTDVPAAYRRAIQIGVDGIQTDKPDALLAVLRELPQAVAAPGRGQRAP